MLPTVLSSPTFSKPFGEVHHVHGNELLWDRIPLKMLQSPMSQQKKAVESWRKKILNESDFSLTSIMSHDYGIVFDHLRFESNFPGSEAKKITLVLQFCYIDSLQALLLEKALASHMRLLNKNHQNCPEPFSPERKMMR